MNAKKIWFISNLRRHKSEISVCNYCVSTWWMFWRICISNESTCFDSVHDDVCRYDTKLIQYKNYFLTWNAQFSNKFDFETVYFVFRLKIFEIKRKFKRIFKLIVWLSYNLSYKMNNSIRNIVQILICFLFATLSRWFRNTLFRWNANFIIHTLFRWIANLIIHTLFRWITNLIIHTLFR